MIKAIIFDMDGVLVETEIAYINMFDTVLNNHNIPHNIEDAYELIGKSWENSGSILDKIGNGILSGKELIDLCFAHMENTPFNYNDIKTNNMKELLMKLKEEGYLIGVASASRKEEIFRALKQTEFYLYVDTYYSGYDCKNNKPAPDVYLKVMDTLQVAPEECVILEDSFSGIQAAKASKAYTVARKDTRFNIDQSHADTHVVDVYELLSIIENLNKEV